VTTAWIDVDQGRRRLDWTVCFRDVANTDYLTPLGQQAGARTAADLETFLGPDWLHRAPTHPTVP